MCYLEEGSGIFFFFFLKIRRGEWYCNVNKAPSNSEVNLDVQEGYGGQVLTRKSLECGLLRKETIPHQTRSQTRLEGRIWEVGVSV